MTLTFILLFLGVNHAFREAGPFLSVLIAFLFCTQMSWWNWATLRLRLPRGNPRVSQSFSSQELLAGLPAGAQGWPLARAAMPTLLRARLALPVLAQIQAVLGVDAALGWLESVRWVTQPSLALRVLCRTMPCLGNCILVSVLALLCITPSAFIPCRELAGNAGRKSRGDVVTNRGGNLSKSSWPKSTTPRAVSPRLLRSPCGRGLSDWQAGAQPAVELHFPQGEGQQRGSRGADRAGVSSSQLPGLPFPVT